MSLYDMFVKLRDTAVKSFRNEAVKEIFLIIQPSHVRGATYGDEPVRAGQHYIQLWLAEMYLAQSRNWFVDWHPAVYSVVRLRFGSQTLELPFVAGELNLGQIKASNLQHVIRLNKELIPLTPYIGGTVNLSAGLLAMQSKDSTINQFIKVVGDFASLLNIPQISSILGLANQVASSIQELIGVSNGSLQLGLDYTFAEEGGGANVLKPCYAIAIRAVEGRDLDPHKFWVVNDQLRYGESLDNNEPFTGYDYMLFRIESRKERPASEWSTFSAISTPYTEARRVLAREGKAQAQVLLNSAMVAAQESHDLIEADRWRAMRQLRADFESMAATMGLGAVPADDVDLGQIMELAMPVDQARALGEPSFEELFVYPE